MGQAPAFAHRMALCTSVFESDSLSDALTRTAELGYQRVELVADLPHLFPAHWTVGQAARLARQLEELQLQVSNLSAETGRGFFSPIPAGPIYEPSLITPHTVARRLRLQHLRRCLDFAFTLGAPCITVSSGFCLPGISPAQAFEVLQEALTVLLSHAEELGILVAIAPRPGQLIARTEDFLALHEAIAHPLLGLHLDLAQLALQHEPAAPAILSSAGRIWTVAATDAKLPHCYRLRPGQGDVDLDGMLQTLQMIGYQGPLTLHLENYQDMADQAAHEGLLALSDKLSRVALQSGLA